MAIIILVVLSLGFIFLKPSSPSSPSPSQPNPQTTVVAENLDTPWGLVFLPDGSILVTERSGQIRLMTSSGRLEEYPVLRLDTVKEVGEGGLLGITVHPSFSENNYTYLYYTYAGSGNDTLNRVSRFNYQDRRLQNEQIIVDNIPGARNHNGGRIKFGPDNFLYITTGDAENPSEAQNTNSLAGKILRVTDEGKPAPGNPFNNLVYSYGHRNPQGLAWDSARQLWATEHGKSGVQSGLDELNKIEPGKNYGWPEIEGNKARDGMVTPFLHSGSTTWAPAGAVFFENSMFFAGLRGQTLYEANFQKNQITIKEHFQGKFGRIRDVILGPDNMIYITTSNKDGRGNPQNGDDKIIRINLI